MCRLASVSGREQLAWLLGEDDLGEKQQKS
jgi:hypothetical protein